MHPKCAQKEPTYLPNRVVDVSCSPPRLYLSRGESDKYACLSYSWGGDQPLKLTTDNLPFYLKELPLAQLPQTLQDAILVTQKLGIRYLWIDSLCIIQNVPADKKAEIARMREIYKHTWVTIAAASTKGAVEGFLAPRKVAPLQEVFVPFHSLMGELGAIGLVRSGIYRPVNHIETYLDPIERRGWTLEEKLLSPRLLIYSSTNLRWVCNTVSAHDGGNSTFRYKPMFDLLRIESNEPRDKRWRDIIRDYSSRLMTEDRDKLLAIAGMAAECNVDGQDEYLAGLWRKTLIPDLLWRVEDWIDDVTDHRPTRARPVDYRAPSWSWASLDLRVYWPNWQGDVVQHDDLHIAACRVTLAVGQKLYGEVTHGELRLRAPLVLQKAGQEVRPDDLSKEWVLSRDDSEDFESVDAYATARRFDNIANTDLPADRDLYYVFLGYLDKLGSKVWTGLLLHRESSPSVGDKTFVRVGWFSVDDAQITPALRNYSVEEVVIV
jgi:hypothetical protein